MAPWLGIMKIAIGAGKSGTEDADRARTLGNVGKCESAKPADWIESDEISHVLRKIPEDSQARRRFFTRWGGTLLEFSFQCAIRAGKAATIQ